MTLDSYQVPKKKKKKGGFFWRDVYMIDLHGSLGLPLISMNEMGRLCE